MRRLRTARDEPSEAELQSSEWRRERLLRIGVPRAVAESVADDPRFDLHQLLELTDRGCDPVLALRILAPLEADAP